MFEKGRGLVWLCVGVLFLLLSLGIFLDDIH